MKFLKLFLIGLILLFSVTVTTYAQESTGVSENPVFKAGDYNYTQITDKSKTKDYLKTVKHAKKELMKELKNDGITFENPAIFENISMDVTAVIYEMHSEKVDLDEVSSVSFIITDNDIVSQYIKVVELDNENQHMTLVQNSKTYSDFIVKNDEEYVSGWVLNSENGKIDVTSEEYKNIVAQATIEESEKIQPMGFNSCMDKCFDDSAIPKWVQDSINVVATVSCVFGPNPVCLLAITQVAATYGSKGISCAIKCL